MRRFPAIVLLSLFAAFALATSASADTLRLRADSWMPYNGDPASKLPGYAIEIARAIFGPRNIELDYANLSWGDALKAAAAGEIDAVVGANQQEAEGLVVPQEPIGFPRIGFFARKDNPARYDNVPALAKYKLGVILDYKYWTALDAYIERSDAPQVVKFSGEQPLEDALAQLHAETSSVFAWTAKSAGHSAGTFRLVYLHEGDPVYFAFAPGERGQRHAALFDEGLRALRRSGALAKILARYGQPDWGAALIPRALLTHFNPPASFRSRKSRRFSSAVARLRQSAPKVPSSTIEETNGRAQLSRSETPIVAMGFSPRTHDARPPRRVATSDLARSVSTSV